MHIEATDGMPVPMIPTWLHVLSAASIFVAIVGSAIVAIDVFRHPQHMWIMAIVWPLTTLFTSLAGLWAYFSYGRLATHRKAKAAIAKNRKLPSQKQTPFTVKVAKGTCHCGAGCCIGDILAEWLAFLVPIIAVWLGWKTLFPEKMFAVWVLDFIFAFFLGIAFQYFTIKPMRDLSPAQGVVQAVKADTLSLTAWQLGMYGFMAFAQFYLFGHLLGFRLEANSIEFWFVMQLAMIAGFITSYPANWWLIKRGVKEEMGPNSFA